LVGKPEGKRGLPEEKRRRYNIILKCILYK
jgi:hypothetical protein